MNCWKSVAAVIAMAVLLSSAALAQSKGKGKPTSETSIGNSVRAVLPASEPVFAASEVTLIQNWFHTNTSSLPPGLAKRETLPPGLQKQLVRKGSLPPGLQKKIQPLPIVLERQLSPVPTGYRRVVIAGNVILMEPVTGVIYDVIRNVIP
jgi:hypothetical protein